eukprot:581394_1
MLCCAIINTKQHIDVNSTQHAKVIKERETLAMLHTNSFNKCDQPISSCSSIQRIISYLDQYKRTKLTDIDCTFNHETYPLLTDDFNHVLVAHLGDYMPLTMREEAFESICDHVCHRVKACTLEQCTEFQRNSRNRETQNISDAMDLESKYYVEMMDSMHCFFLHSFDIGFRIRAKEM